MKARINGCENFERCFAGFGLQSDDPTSPTARLLEASQQTLDEQVRQAKIIVVAIIAALKQYVSDYLFAGKLGDPTPDMLAACKHVKPNNDAQERSFGIVDFRIKKHPHETTEMTDARLKLVTNNPLTVLAAQGEAKAIEAWQAARGLMRKRKRDEKERRTEYRQAKIAKVQEKVQKEEKKERKKQQKQAEFRAVKVVRTVAELHERMQGFTAKLQKQFLRAQIQQLTGQHGVSKHTLPLTHENKRLEADALYSNLVALLEHGDPTKPATEAKLREQKRIEKKPKRGRPKRAKR